jgi:hypothetical protein
MSQTWNIDLIDPATTPPATDIQRLIDGLLCVRSNFSGASEPTGADRTAYMFWADTTTGLLKQRNAADSAWITIGTMASTNLGLAPLAGAQMTGGVNEAKATIASATTPTIFGLTNANVIDYTGTTTCTGFTAAPVAGARRVLICAAAAPFTAGATMLIDGFSSGQTFTAEPGDQVHVVAFTTTQFRLTVHRVNALSVQEGLRQINSQSAAYPIVLNDRGKCILHPTADNNPRTFTIPANASIAFPIGTTIKFVNQINTVTIAITTDTLTLSPGGTTGSRTLAAHGVAEAIKVTTTLWYISGSGLT